MQIEQLKLILETVGQAADGAKSVAIWWLALEFIKVLLGYALGAGGIYAVYRTLRGLITSMTLGPQLRDIMDPTEAGSYFGEEERTQVIETFKKGLAQTEK